MAKTIYILIGQARRDGSDGDEGVHVILTAADEEAAIDEAYAALGDSGYAEAEFSEIGELDAMPDDEPHASAWKAARKGEVAVINFDEADED